MFRDLYSQVEAATKLSLVEFLQDQNLRSRVRKAVIEMLSLVEQEGKSLVGGDDVMWNLVKFGVISTSLAQEILDIIDVVNQEDDALLYASLVRIMEDLEEAYHAIMSRKARAQGSFNDRTP